MTARQLFFFINSIVGIAVYVELFARGSQHWQPYFYLCHLHSGLNICLLHFLILPLLCYYYLFSIYHIQSLCGLGHALPAEVENSIFCIQFSIFNL